MGLVLDDVEADFRARSRATEKARKVLKTITEVKNTLAVAAVVSRNPAPVMASVADLLKTVTAAQP